MILTSIATCQAAIRHDPLGNIKSPEFELEIVWVETKVARIRGADVNPMLSYTTKI